jgi:hypothetical protein
MRPSHNPNPMNPCSENIINGALWHDHTLPGHSLRNSGK